MAAIHDSDVAPAADPGSGSGVSEKNCFLCGTDLGLDWPDLSKLNTVDMKNHAYDCWNLAAKSGCNFCNIIISVVDDIGKQHGCSILGNHKGTNEALLNHPEDGLQVFLGLNELTERYLLALEMVWMPLLVDPEMQNEFWGVVTVYLDGPDIFNTQLEPFCEIPGHGGSVKTMDNARDWLTTCQKDHADCSAGLEKDENISAPSDSWIRILEICEEKLKLTNVRLGRDLPSYVALSHCWGSCRTLKTLSTNIESHRTGIEHRDLPPTFADAIKVTKLLGFEHIWIDSLCIIQDSPTDWEEQSSQMASIYGNADLVLAASSASSTEDGFLKERKGYRESTLQIPSVRNQEHVLNLRYRLLQPKGMAPMLDPLDCRAWALQERLVARRYLAFGSHDMSWTCTTTSACECEWWRASQIWRHEITNIKKLVQEATVDALGGLWRRKVLRNYFRRFLTFSSDNLVALSALASIFQKKSKAQYCAGIWQDDLIPGLLWYHIGVYPGYASDYSAPSWSWASLPILDLCGTMDGRPRPFEAQARVLASSTTTSTSNQFGSVCSGFIKLWGSLWRAEVTTSKLNTSASSTCVHPLKVKGFIENRFMLYFDTSLKMTEACLSAGARERSLRRVRREEVQDEFYVGSVQESDMVNLFMVPLQNVRDSTQRKHTLGLILGRSPKDPTKFERIGMFSTWDLSFDHEDGLDNCDEQEVVII